MCASRQWSPACTTLPRAIRRPHNFNWYLSPYGPAGYTVATLGDFSVWMNAQYLGYWQAIYKRFHAPSVDYLIIPNVDQMTTGWYAGWKET